MKADLLRPEKLAYAVAVAGLLFVAAGLGIWAASKSAALLPATVAAGAVVVFGLVAAGRVRLARRETEEARAVAAFKAGRAGAELFQDSADEALKAAVKAQRAYVRYFLPAFTVVAGVGLLTLSYFIWIHGWSGSAVRPALVLPLRYAVLSFSVFVVAMLAGSYFSGISRESGCRYLRPCGAWLLFAGGLFALAGAVMLGVNWQLPLGDLDLRVAQIGLALVLLLAVEQSVNVIIEFYRPRQAREEERPLFESRLLALVTEPGGIARNVATALDYQFGFRVSEIWFYRFLERTVIPFAGVAVAGLWLMTCFVVVNAEENGLLIRFGGVVNRPPLKPLGPGLYVKLPWPFARIYTFPVERVQELAIGYVPSSAGDKPEMPDPSMEGMQGDLTGRVMVWSKTHHKQETNFVVASSSEADPRAEKAAPTGKNIPVNVNFMAASIPVYFKVTDLYAYAFGHSDARRTLDQVANREVVRYLASSDFTTVLGEGRRESGEKLRDSIQASANELKLGVEIVFVGLQGIHPPVKIGKAFDEVVAALEEQHEEVLKAQREAASLRTTADTGALVRVNAANAYRNERTQVAAAEGEQFEKQLIAYKAAPRLYVLYTFLDMLENEGNAARKYVVALDKSQEVFVINLEKKLRPDLLDLDLGQEAK